MQRNSSIRIGRTQPSGDKGFSLIEVTMSLGIVAFVTIPLIAMLSVGMTSNRSSADRAVVSQIVDQVGREVEQSDFSSLPDEFPITHFDEQGVQVEEDDPMRVFTARVRVIKGVDIPASGGVFTSTGLARVLVDVAPNPNDISMAVLFEEDENGGLSNPEAKRFTLFVSRND